MTIGGIYQAQWRKIDGRWLIQGELYVPTHCRGSEFLLSASLIVA